jgi:hypothetical protein
LFLVFEKVGDYLFIPLFFEAAHYFRLNWRLKMRLHKAAGLNPQRVDI